MNIPDAELKEMLKRGARERAMKRFFRVEAINEEADSNEKAKEESFIVA